MTAPLPDPAGIFERAPELAEMALADERIRKAIARGDLHAIYRALWWARLLGRLPHHRPTLDALLAHRALFVTPARRSPVLSTVNGLGATVYGSADRDSDGSYIKTHFLVFVFLPVFPLAQYLVKDGEGKGWYFLGKVPMSAPIRIWNRLGVLAVFAALLVGAFQAVQSSRYHEVHVVNGLPWPVHATIGEVALDVPPSERRSATVRTGRQPVRVTSAKGEPIETGDLQVEAGTDLLVWNVLGAAPVFERTVVYTSAKAQPGEGTAPEPRLLCGERSIKLSDVDHKFSEPPQTVSMSESQHVAYRRQVGVFPGDIEVCVEAIAAAGQAEPALALARGLASLDPVGDRTPLAIALCRAVGKTDEGLRLAEQALKLHPASVEHHRVYQSMAEDLGKTTELLATYKARFEAAPDSPDAAYLYARLLPEPGGLALATTYSQRFPDHVALRRILIFRQMRERRFQEALASIERVQALDRREWTRFVDDHVAALAGVGRVEDAKRLAAEAFARKEGPQVMIAGMHAWLSGGTGPAAESLITKLAAGAPLEQLELRIRFWTAPANVSLAPLAQQPDRPLYTLMQDAHYNPRAALKTVSSVRAEDLSQLNPEVLVLLLGEAHASHDAAARKKLETVAQRRLPVGTMEAYLEQGTWAKDLDELPLTVHGALHLARSREAGLPPREKEQLRSLAYGCDPVGGYVRMALGSWPAS